MTADSRLTTLEAEVAELKLALEAERKERRALPELLVPKAVEMQRGLHDLEEHFELTKLALGERLQALADGAPEGVRPLLLEVTGLITEVARDAISLQRSTLDNLSKLCDRLERLERTVFGERQAGSSVTFAVTR